MTLSKCQYFLTLSCPSNKNCRIPKIWLVPKILSARLIFCWIYIKSMQLSTESWWPTPCHGNWSVLFALLNQIWNRSGAISRLATIKLNWNIFELFFTMAYRFKLTQRRGCRFPLNLYRNGNLRQCMEFGISNSKRFRNLIILFAARVAKNNKYIWEHDSLDIHLIFATFIYPRIVRGT
jgi:hypothetical protein